MTQRVADLMVEILAQAGAQRCYGIVGDTHNPCTKLSANHISSFLQARDNLDEGFLEEIFGCVAVVHNKQYV